MTGKDIILKARRIADIVNSKFISDEEALEYLNEAYRVYYDKIIASSDWAMISYEVEKEAVHEYSDGNRVYWVIDTPEDMYKLRGLSVRVGGCRRDLRVFPKLEEYTFPELSYRLTAENKIKVINPGSAEKTSFLIEYFPPPQEIVFEKELLSAEFDFERSIQYCFDCGEYFVFGHEYNTEDHKYYIWVVSKSDLSVVRKCEVEDNPQIIGVSKEWIYYFKMRYDGYDTAVIMRTSVSDPFAIEEHVYTDTVEEGETTRFTYFDFVSQSEDTLYLTHVSYTPGEGTIITYDIKLLSVKDGQTTVDYTTTYTIDQAVEPIHIYFRTSEMFIRWEQIPTASTPDYKYYACKTWEEAISGGGIDLTQVFGTNKGAFFIDGRALHLAVEGVSEFEILTIKEDFSTYTLETPEKYTTPTPLETDPYWEIYTKNEDENVNVYIAELPQPEAPYLPVGANEDYLAYYLAVCFLQKQGKDASDFSQKLAEIEYRLIEELTADEHRHQSVANNFRRNNSGWGWL